ncbi:glycosyltransferase [Kingella negevensis]|uniref:glycosyltransferase n=1 Tax=Kingella negevensis TaxID=1522312 RepID=UPI0025429F83|nr:glycosyltransferase [Kingella negevensis]WII92407.1 glycosyltransferase [Kingella negevensis]
MNFTVLMSLYIKEQPENLRQSLQSLADQTQRASEIIIVLDGNITPELQAVLDQFQPILPLNIFRLPENVGLGKALNFGLQHCTHEWVFRMDTDDIATHTRFAEQCQYIAQNPNVQLLGGQIAEFAQNPEHARHARIVPQTQPEIISFAKKRNPFNHMTVAYTKTTVQQAGGYQHHLFMEDYNLWLRMLAKGATAANLPQTLVYARTGNAMLERRRGWQYVQSEWQLMRLKHRLRFQAALPAFGCFLLRSVPRVLPAKWLRGVYQVIRK